MPHDNIFCVGITIIICHSQSESYLLKRAVGRHHGAHGDGVGSGIVNDFVIIHIITIF